MSNEKLEKDLNSLHTVCIKIPYKNFLNYKSIFQNASLNFNRGCNMLLHRFYEEVEAGNLEMSESGIYRNKNSNSTKQLPTTIEDILTLELKTWKKIKEQKELENNYSDAAIASNMENQVQQTLYKIKAQSIN